MPEREAVRRKVGRDHPGQARIVFDHQDSLDHEGILP
jgi:hypothetical protein